MTHNGGGGEAGWLLLDSFPTGETIGSEETSPHGAVLTWESDNAV